MTQAIASIVLDSISPDGIRLTTFQLRYWRPIHSELMTHRVFSRNAGSSRARPSAKIIEQVRNEPWGPIHWGANQAGMQAHAEMDEQATQQAKANWHLAARQAADAAEAMVQIGAHKQIVNRLLEPFTYIDVLVTATDYANWFALRDHPDAQPEIQELARLMKEAIHDSNPRLIHYGEWHLPYIESKDVVDAVKFLKEQNGYQDFLPHQNQINDLLKKASAARCARVSYKLFDGSKTDFGKDLELFERLLVSQPLHASPAEHQATPDRLIMVERKMHLDEDGGSKHLGTGYEWANPRLQGNLRGWIQYRKTLPNEFIPR